jgi:hypothetical protein
VREVPELRPGLVLALATARGAFGGLELEHQDPFVAFWARAIGADGVAIGRLASHPGAQHHVGELASITPPEELSGPDDALSYARAVAARLSGTMSASLLLARRTAGGLVGWAAGAAAVHRLGPKRGLCSPSQLAQIPAMHAGATPMVASGIAAGGPVGGDWFACEGGSFVLSLGALPLALDDDELEHLDATSAQDVLAQAAMAVAARCEPLPHAVGFWRAPGRASYEQGSASHRLWCLGVPTTWADLFDPVRGEPARCLEERFEADACYECDPSPQTRVVAYGALGDWLAEAIALAGPAQARTLLAPSYQEHALAIRRVLGGPDRWDQRRAFDAIAYGRGAACIGWPVESAVDAEAWATPTAAPADYDESGRVTGAASALAEARPDLAASWLGGALPPAPSPGASFGMHTSDFLRALAATMRDRAPASVLGAGYEEWLRAFPAKLAAGSARWPDLVAVAVAFHARLGGVALADIGAHLHDEVRALASERGPAGVGAPREVSAEVGGQRGQLGFARLRVRFVPRDRDDIVVRSSLEDARLHPALRDAATDAIRARVADHGLRALGATLIDALVHPTDATQAAFARAGASAVDAYVGRAAPTR